MNRKPVMDLYSVERSVLNQVFEMKARDYWQWILLAKDLGKVAEETWKIRNKKAEKKSDQIFTIGRVQSRSRIAFALLGMAFENVFKGLMIKRDPKMISEGKFSKAFPATHDLERLVKKLNWSLRPEEIYLLRRISPYILWFSRYPVPLNSEKIQIYELGDADFKRALRLCAKLLNLAASECMSD